MAIEDDDKPRKKITHEIGQDLSLLSVEELTERIALMNSEIERLQAGRHEEARVKGCGEQFFQDVGFRDTLSHHVVPCERRDPYAAAYLVAGRWPTFSQSSSPVVTGPCVRRDDQPLESIIKLGQWPTWQIIPKENRSFTVR